ncbi:MAG: DUF2849 domain-containing protein [Beijerinckiaceae bacterium]
MGHVISANRLADGAVVYLGPDGWVESLASSQVFPDAASAEKTLEDRGKRDAARNLIVEPGVVAVRVAHGRLQPAHMREAIRANGPTVRTDLGKQSIL